MSINNIFENAKNIFTNFINDVNKNKIDFINKTIFENVAKEFYWYGYSFKFIDKTPVVGWPVMPCKNDYIDMIFCLDNTHMDIVVNLEAARKQINECNLDANQEIISLVRIANRMAQQAQYIKSVGGKELLDRVILDASKSPTYNVITKDAEDFKTGKINSLREIFSSYTQAA